jgi:hypothetical protein
MIAGLMRETVTRMIDLLVRKVSLDRLATPVQPSPLERGLHRFFRSSRSSHLFCFASKRWAMRWRAMPRERALFLRLSRVFVACANWVQSERLFTLLIALGFARAGTLAGSFCACLGVLQCLRIFLFLSWRVGPLVARDCLRNLTLFLPVEFVLLLLK